MSLQEQIDHLIRQPRTLGGLPLDRSMLGIALRMGTEGGKRFRPWLFQVVHDQLAPADVPPVPQETLDRIAASIELLHSAFVVHDDVIDNDDTRRGHSSVPGWFRGSTADPDTAYPRAGAILTGDLALAAAVRGIATCGADSAVTTALLDLLDSTLYDSAVGELADVRLTMQDVRVSLDDAISVAELKTAAYSFVLPMQAAAIVAGASPSTITAVGEIGRSLGIAFQMRDDLLGTFAPAEVLGKDPDGDLREGKRTPLIVHASSTSHWRQIEPHLGNPELTPADADAVRQALVDAGSVLFVEELIARHCRLARRAATGLDLEESVVDALTQTWTPIPVPAPTASKQRAGVA